MKIWVVVGLLVGFSGMAGADEHAIPAAVITDPVPDPINPPHSAQVLIPSHGMGMNGLFYLAGGAGPHPTIVLLARIPRQRAEPRSGAGDSPGGLERAHHALSRVMGKPGVFSIAHVLEDVDAAVAFVRQPDIAAKYGIDTHRIVLGGHSMGGFATAAHTRADDHLLGAVLLDAWNAGATGDELGKQSPAELEKIGPRKI